MFQLLPRKMTWRRDEGAMKPPDPSMILAPLEAQPGESERCEMRFPNLPRERDPCFQRDWMIVYSTLDARKNPLFREWLKLVLLGVCTGFAERGLDPELPEHHEVFSRIVKDVSGIYSQLRDMQPEKSSESLKSQVFDYGVQWAYYLDWKLYMSKDLY